MVWAEMGGINGIWKTWESHESRRTPCGPRGIHHGLSIEQIIEKTWQPKEKVPEIAKPDGRAGELLDCVAAKLSNPS